MFGRSMFSEMRNDPFFSHHNSMFAEMDRMMGDFDRSFGMFPAIGGVDTSSRIDRRLHNEITPFGGGNMFGSMFSNMDAVMTQMRNNPSSHSYSSTQVMSYSNDGRTEPKYYQATSETTQGPGGIRQTRKSERNSETGLDRMAVGHHIYDRGHVVERRLNRRTNEREENQEYINMDEGDKDTFQQEWQEKSRSLRSVDRNYHHRRDGPMAIDSREYNRDNLERHRQGRDRVQNERRRQRDSDRYNDRHVRINSHPEEI